MFCYLSPILLDGGVEYIPYMLVPNRMGTTVVGPLILSQEFVNGLTIHSSTVEVPNNRGLGFEGLQQGVGVEFSGLGLSFSFGLGVHCVTPCLLED